MKQNIDERLQKAAEEYIELPDSCLEYSDDGWEDKTDCNYVEKAFKAGAEWQKQQMMKNAVKGGCFSYRNGYKHISCDIDEKLTDIKFGDKIKVIVIKEG